MFSSDIKLVRRLDMIFRDSAIARFGRKKRCSLSITTQNKYLYV